ncbi:methylglyoxal synthase [Streptomyces sp. NPDC057137]|uniref:methylglyoxal synthase n=1 Tax=Streptomyces sp. NPDC057137 TaxID=3346030 RepID=UPI003631064F
MPFHGNSRQGSEGHAKPAKAIALIAHDAKKAELVEWIERHQQTLRRYRLVATRGTGALLAAELSLEVTCVESGPQGGDQQIGAMIVEGKIAMVIFFTDPLTAQAHSSDVEALLRLAVVHNVPMAQNPSSADLLLREPAGQVRPAAASAHWDGR